MVRVAVTGAAGSVGRETLAGLADHDVTPITHREREGIEGPVLDVVDPGALDGALDGHDVVVHLAGNPSPAADWDSVLTVNIDGTRNVYEAARKNDLDRVVFASTNHVMQMHNIGERDSPGTQRSDARPVTVGDSTRPDSYYAVSKVAGEALGSYYADRYDLEVVNLRIGWLLTESELHEVQAEPESRARYARSMWLSPRDCRDGVRAAVEADIESSPTTVNLLSRNRDRYLSLVEGMRTLGYEPRDDSAEALSR